MKAILLHSYLLKPHIYLLVNLYRFIRLSNVSYIGTPNSGIWQGNIIYSQCDFSLTMTHTSLGFPGEQEMMTSIGKQTWLHESHNRTSNCLILKWVLQRGPSGGCFVLPPECFRKHQTCTKPPPSLPSVRAVKQRKSLKIKEYVAPNCTLQQYLLSTPTFLYSPSPPGIAEKNFPQSPPPIKSVQSNHSSKLQDKHLDINYQL